MTIALRRARVEDKARVLQVEAKATPNLRYLGAVFEHWVHDRVGELLVAELDGALVGVGKLTVVPDGTAWLEALRVVPEAQGQGVGKRFYRRFLAIARDRGISTLRMYTGVNNAASKGLAERHGFRLAGTYHGAALPVQPLADETTDVSFAPVKDAFQAARLLLPFHGQWAGFLVMNRTFYALTPSLCAAWAAEGKVYHEAVSGSVLALGARFQADLALHIACLGGDSRRCLLFARQRARQLAAAKLQCMFPPGTQAVEQILRQEGFQSEPSDCIVMEARIDAG